MKITTKEVENLAGLSALEFSPEEKEELVADLTNILAMVNEIQGAESLGEDVYNRSHKLCELREDEIEESFAPETILQNAPKQRRNCFNVPLVVE